MREDLADWLEGFAVSHDDDCTVLVGPVERGATSVVQLLLRLQAAGLEIVDVRRERLANPTTRPAGTIGPDEEDRLRTTLSGRRPP